MSYRYSTLHPPPPPPYTHGLGFTRFWEVVIVLFFSSLACQDVLNEYAPPTSFNHNATCLDGTIKRACQILSLNVFEVLQHTMIAELPYYIDNLQSTSKTN